MSDTVEINLVKPTHGFDASQEITKLTLRRPTGKEILACGYPFVLVRDGNLGTVSERVDVKAMTSLAAACCGVLTSSIERLDAVDIYELFESIRIFFHYGLRKKSSVIISNVPAGPATQGSSSV